MKPATKKLYLDASKNALDNAHDIFEEASILYKFDHYPRAFALGILTAEEIAKSYIYRSVSAELLDPSLTRVVTLNHEQKLVHFKNLLVLVFTLADFPDEISKASKHDKGKPHSEHVMPEVMEKIVLASTNILFKVFSNVHNIKLDSIYVDVRENKISNPKNVINKTKCDELFTVLGKALPVSKIIIPQNDDTFKDFTKMFLLTIKQLAKEQGREF